MRKAVFLSLSALFVFWLVCLLSYDKGLLVNSLNVSKTKAAASDVESVTLSVNILDYLSFTVSSGGTISLGNLTPGAPVCNSSGTVFLVSTNASNGYKMTPSDGSATNSALSEITGVHILDYLGTLATPTTWTGSGLGVTLWSGVQREAAWSVGGVATDACALASTKWAGVPANSTATTGHTVTGYLAGPDTTYWGWKVDVPNTQKTGAYTGAVTFTVVNVLS